MAVGGAPPEWLVEYLPVIELHHAAFDGTPEQRAVELYAAPPRVNTHACYMYTCT